MGVLLIFPAQKTLNITAMNEKILLLVNQIFSTGFQN